MQREVKRTRPGGRTERNRKAVAMAVLELIGDGNIEFEIQDVVRLSQVARATIFRRWPDRAALIGEALAEHVSRVSLVQTDNWVADLYENARVLLEFFRDPIERALNRTMVLSNSASFRQQIIEYWQPIIEQVKEPLRAAQRRGEMSGEVDVDTLTAMLFQVLLMETLVDGSASGENFPVRVVDQLLRGCVLPAALKAGK